MNDIVFPNSTLQKAVIYPEESGIYKATINGKNFYVIVEDSCVSDIRIKWLGENGFYKHGTFSIYTSEKHSSKEGVSVEIFNYSLSEAVAKSSLVSKSNQRTLTLQKKNVRKDIYKMYIDLAKSPKVYLNLGDLRVDKWIEVSVKWTPNLIYKKEFQDISIEVDLPEDYIQKL